MATPTQINLPIEKPKGKLTRLGQTVRLANSIAQNSGFRGAYFIQPHAIYWGHETGCELVAHIVGESLYVPEASEVEHDAFVVAACLKLREVSS